LGNFGYQSRWDQVVFSAQKIGWLVGIWGIPLFNNFWMENSKTLTSEKRVEKTLENSLANSTFRYNHCVLTVP
jgi:hypothetical protein